MNIFGLRVKQYLLENNLKQKQIVDRLGLSKNAISQALNRENISLDKMQAISNALDCDLIIELKPRQNSVDSSENK